LRAALAALIVTLAPLAAAAQNLFAPVMQVNERVITQYEVEQRVLFYTLLNAPGDPRETAMERLVEEKLQLTAADDLGLVLTPEQVIAGQDEFAQRANLDRETFIKALAQGGVEEQTFRDFVETGLLWREVVRQKFGPKVKVSEAEIDQALSATVPRAGAIRLLFSEIILPANTPAAREASQRRAAEISQYTTIDQFSRAARAFSVAPSRGRGGRLDWVEVANMQPGLAQVLLALAPGQVSAPLPIPNAIALFQLREVQDGLAPLPSPLTVDYAIWRIPGAGTAAASAEAAKVVAGIDTCNELFELNRKQGGDAARLERTSADIAEVPADIALELAQLDPNEFSPPLVRGPNLALVMLCSRQVPLPEDVTRDSIRARLLDQRIQAYAAAYLAELQAEAIIRVP
jgi:peptidyl-prolyl cis-trans isomerase SurA